MSAISLVAAVGENSEYQIAAVGAIGPHTVIMWRSPNFGYSIWDSGKSFTYEEVKIFANMVLPPTECQHEGDCCGHTYLAFNRVEWVEDEREGDMWRICPQYIRNE